MLATLTQARAAYQRAWDLADEKFGTTFTRLPLDFKLKGRTAGRCWYGRRISINLEMLRSEAGNGHILNQTIPHEVAHEVAFQLDGSTGHNDTWARVMTRCMGIDADQHHALDVAACTKGYSRFTCIRCHVHYSLSKIRQKKMTRNLRHYVCRCGGTLRNTDRGN